MREPCPHCTDGTYVTTQMDGTLTRAVCWHCLGCQTIPVRITTPTERKAA